MPTPCPALCESCAEFGRPPLPRSGPISPAGPLPRGSGLQSVEQERECECTWPWNSQVGAGLGRAARTAVAPGGHGGHAGGHPGLLPVFGRHLLCAWSGLSSRWQPLPARGSPSPRPPGQLDAAGSPPLRGAVICLGKEGWAWMEFRIQGSGVPPPPHPSFLQLGL